MTSQLTILPFFYLPEKQSMRVCMRNTLKLTDIWSDFQQTLPTGPAR